MPLASEEALARSSFCPALRQLSQINIASFRNNSACPGIHPLGTLRLQRSLSADRRDGLQAVTILPLLVLDSGVWWRALGGFTCRRLTS
jgi:hypothetical protein